MAAPREDYDTGIDPSAVDPRRPAPIDTPWGSFAVFSCAGRLYAAQSFCPHLMGPLFQGTVSGETVTCPWHQWRFSLATGKRLDFLGHEHLAKDRLATLEVFVGPNGTIHLREDRRETAAGP